MGTIYCLRFMKHTENKKEQIFHAQLMKDLWFLIILQVKIRKINSLKSHWHVEC